MKETPKDRLHSAVEAYIREVFQEYNPAYHHKLSAGVEAFIHVNYWQQPYYPVDAYPVEEKPKKWYQFWINH